MSAPRYDVIGDIHGQADKLERLLRGMNYELEDGVFQAPTGHQAIFLGDFINRGPAIPRTLAIVRAMVERGGARAVMGNHEFNALACAADGAQAKLSPEMDTLFAFRDDLDAWESHLAWFQKLPLFLDLGSLRIVHACWNDEAVLQLGEGAFTADLLRPRGSKPNPRQAAADLLLRGPEFPLPKSVAIQRSKVRIQWWRQDCPNTFRAVGLSPEELPDLPLPPEAGPFLGSYPREAPPVLFGHYGYPKPPLPFAPNLACLDLAIARGGPLCAYRWQGERALRPEHYLTVH